MKEGIDIDRRGRRSARSGVGVLVVVGHRTIVALPCDAQTRLAPAGELGAREYDPPVISVCMATFNGARYVHRQVETIVAQLGPDDELVVSDDSSSDDTVAIVRAFDDPRIRILEGNTFRSPLLNFEHAIQQARGDTIVLADQDDVWLENKLPLVRELFEQEGARPFLVVLDAEVVDEDERQMYPSVLEKLDAGPGLLKNLWTNRYLGCCMAFSHDLLDAALPFPPGAAMHDIWLGQLCERIGTTRFVHVVTMRYRRHADTATGFEIRFEPVRQIARRTHLAWLLATRTIRSRGTRRPSS